MAKRAEPTVKTALDIIETTRVGRWARSLAPHVIRGVASRLGITWEVPYVRTGLRGAKRARIAAWLAGA